MRQLDFGLRMPATEHGENLFEVELLASIGDVNDFVRMPGFEPMRQRGQIGRGVVEGAVALLNQTRIGRPLALLVNQERVLSRWRRTVRENADGAFAFARDAFRPQFLDHRLEPRLVKTLAQCVIEFHAETVIDPVELDLRQRDHFPPDAQIFRVALLKFHQFPARLFERRGVFLAFGADCSVEALHFGNGIRFNRGQVQVLLPADQQHPELGPPVANVIVRDDVVAEQPQSAREAVAEDRRTNMTDVHRLGDVRRTEVNDDGARRNRLFDEGMFGAQGGLERLSERGSFETKIEKTRAGRLRCFAPFAHV